MSTPTTYRVLMAAGGTGGHVYPAIAIAGALRAAYPSADVAFAGTRTHMEWKAVPAAGYPIFPIWISGFHRRLTVQNILFPLKLVVSLFQSLRIIRRFKPNVVVCCGGYVSGPIGLVAAMLGIPLMLQEQNSFPGVTNRLLGKKATAIFTAFNEAAEYFPKDKVHQYGNPVRNDLKSGNRIDSAALYGFNPSKKTILVMGGSGGAKSINDAMLTNLEKLHNEYKLQIIWQCGRRYIREIHEKINTDEFPNLRLSDFIDNMPNAYAVSDLVVCRAGAGTIAELIVAGKPSILVPSPYVAGDHQTKNAASVVENGAAKLLPDNELSENLAKTINHMLSVPEILENMHQQAKNMSKPDAAIDIAKHILKLTLNPST